MNNFDTIFCVRTRGMHLIFFWLIQIHSFVVKSNMALAWPFLLDLPIQSTTRQWRRSSVASSRARSGYSCKILWKWSARRPRFCFNLLPITQCVCSFKALRHRNTPPHPARVFVRSGIVGVCVYLHSEQMQNTCNICAAWAKTCNAKRNMMLCVCCEGARKAKHMWKWRQRRKQPGPQQREELDKTAHLAKIIIPREGRGETRNWLTQSALSGEVKMNRELLVFF